MKIKIICKPENYNKYKSLLEKSGFIISNDADLTFKEDDYIKDYFIGYQENNSTIINHKDIFYIESFGRDVYLYTEKEEYKIREKLYELEVFEQFGFIRINKSQIVNKNNIKIIKPTLNSRLILILKNNIKIEVNRTYIIKFKEFIGL